jgi:hypothetical protein
MRLNAISARSSAALDSKEAEIIALAYLDAAVCIACFVLTIMARSAQKVQAEAANKEALTIASYTIQVQGLPQDATPLQVCLDASGSCPLHFIIATVNCSGPACC